MGVQIKIIDESKINEIDIENSLIEPLNSEDIINLSDFSIDDMKTVCEDIKGKNEFLSRNIIGVKISGKYALYDKSLESLEVNKLSMWSKISAHEEDSYRKVEIYLTDNLNNVYDTIQFKQAFLVDFKEEYNIKDGIMKYSVYIREFDNNEAAIRV